MLSIHCGQVSRIVATIFVQAVASMGTLANITILSMLRAVEGYQMAVLSPVGPVSHRAITS
jgi:hypothetical protein